MTPRPMLPWSLALGVGELRVTCTPWVTLSVGSSEDPAESTSTHSGGAPTNPAQLVNAQPSDTRNSFP